MLPISLQNMGQEFKSNRLYYRYNCKSWIMFKCLGLDFHQEWDRLFAAHFWFSKLMDLK